MKDPQNSFPGKTLGVLGRTMRLYEFVGVDRMRIRSFNPEKSEDNVKCEVSIVNLSY